MSILRRLGLTEYEEKIYTTLLREGALTGGKLSRLSGVPHGRTYEVIENLSQKGLVSVTPVKPKLFKAVDPRMALPELSRKLREEISSVEDQALGELKNLKNPLKEKEMEDNILIMKGKKNALALIDYSTKNATNSIKAMFTYELVSYNTTRLEEEALKRGVKIRHIATKLSDEGLKRMREDLKRGIEVRYFPIKELRLQIMDGEVVVQTVVNPNDLMDRVNILIKNKELAKALEHYFDSVWKKAKRIEEL